MWLLWFISAANGMVTIQYNILLGHRKYLTYNILSVLTPFIILASLVVLVLLKRSGPFHYLLVIGAAVMVALAGGYWALNRLPASPLEKQPWWEVIKKSFGSGFLNQAGHVISIINSRYVFYLLPAVSLGVFTNALSLAESMLLVPGSMGQIYYSQAAANQSSKGNQQGNNAIFKRFLLISLGIMLLGIMVIWAVPDAFYTWLFGPQFAGVKPYLLILSSGMFLYSIYLLVSYFQSAAGKFERNVVAGLAGLFINVVGVFSLYFSNLLTLTNIVYLMAAAYGCTAFVAFWQYRKQATNRQANA
jgi:O-antigen/teichoic acid export membrane protein